MSLKFQPVEGQGGAPACDAKPKRKTGRLLVVGAVACLVGPCCWPLLVPLLGMASGTAMLVFLGENWGWILAGVALLTGGTVFAIRRWRKRVRTESRILFGRSSDFHKAR